MFENKHFSFFSFSPHHVDGVVARKSIEALELNFGVGDVERRLLDELDVARQIPHPMLRKPVVHHAFVSKAFGYSAIKKICCIQFQNYKLC